MIIGQSASCGRGYDDNLIASNIKKGVGIYDVVGTFEGWVPGDKEIYKYGTWGEGYSASKYIDCTNHTLSGGSYSTTFYTDYISTSVTSGKYGSYMSYMYWFYNHLFHFSSYNRLIIELGNAGWNTGIYINLSPNWGTGWVGNGSCPSGMSVLREQVYAAPNQTTTIDLSSVQQDGYIYFSQSTAQVWIRRIYFE